MDATQYTRFSCCGFIRNRDLLALMFNMFQFAVLLPILRFPICSLFHVQILVSVRVLQTYGIPSTDDCVIVFEIYKFIM